VFANHQYHIGYMLGAKITKADRYARLVHSTLLPYAFTMHLSLLNRFLRFEFMRLRTLSSVVDFFTERGWFDSLSATSWRWQNSLTNSARNSANAVLSTAIMQTLSGKTRPIELPSQAVACDHASVLVPESKSADLVAERQEMAARFQRLSLTVPEARWPHAWSLRLGSDVVSRLQLRKPYYSVAQQPVSTTAPFADDLTAACSWYGTRLA